MFLPCDRCTKGAMGYIKEAATDADWDKYYRGWCPRCAQELSSNVKAC